jgi:hypothetical protein
MINNEAGLRQALEQLGSMYLALAAVRSEHPNATPEWQAVLAEGFLDQARQLQHQIEEYTGASAFEEAQAELWLAVEGCDIRDGVGPASVLTALLDAFRKGVQSVAEFLTAGTASRRPTTALKEACDWRVLALRPGSLKVGLRLPDVPPRQGELWESRKVLDVHQAVDDFLEVAAWAASSGDPEVLAGRFPDPDKRRFLLNAVKPFVPRQRGSVESVTVSGRAVHSGGPIVLTREAPKRIDRAIDRTTAEQVEDHVGDLREIDLDNLTMAIRNAGDVWEVRCTLDESLLQAAKEALDRRVRVSGVRQIRPGRRTVSTLHVFRLEELEEAGTESEASGEGPATAAG